MLGCVKNVLLQVMQHSFENSNRGISLSTNKDGIVLINYLHLKYRSAVNCLSISRLLKSLSKVRLVSVSKIIIWKNFPQIIRASGVVYFQQNSMLSGYSKPSPHHWNPPSSHFLLKVMNNFQYFLPTLLAYQK